MARGSGSRPTPEKSGATTARVRAAPNATAGGLVPDDPCRFSCSCDVVPAAAAVEHSSAMAPATDMPLLVWSLLDRALSRVQDRAGMPCVARAYGCRLSH